jgi:hypothetical protein
MRYNGPANGSDAAASVAVSPDSSKVFVTGKSPGTTSFDDYATVGYNAATGAPLWTRRYNGPGNGADAAAWVTANGSKVFVTGKSRGSTTSDDYATIAYNPATGAPLWAKRHNGPGNGVDGARAVAASPDGSKVFVTGGSTGSGTFQDYGTIAYQA